MMEKSKGKIFARERAEFMLKIAKEGHSYPHYDTCNTCIEDLLESGKFWAKYIFNKYGHTMLKYSQEEFKKEFEIEKKDIKNELVE